MIPPNLPENHKMALRSVATRNNIAENELVRVYQAANDILTTGTTKATNIIPAKMVHPLVGPDYSPGDRVESVTVANITGIFVRLTCEMRKAAGPVLMQTGKLFSMEGTDAVTSSVATRMF